MKTIKLIAILIGFVLLFIAQAVFSQQRLSPTWTCGDIVIDQRNGQDYNTIQIGNQCWMQQNLNVGTMISSQVDMTSNGTIEKWCYNDNLSNCTLYGGLYSWDEAMNYLSAAKGICQSGFHVPTNAEFDTLYAYVGRANRLKAVSGWKSSYSYPATDEVDFSALPGGYRYLLTSNGSKGFALAGQYGNYLTSTRRVDIADNVEYGLYRMISYNYGVLWVYNAYPQSGYSVRCIKD